MAARRLLPSSRPAAARKGVPGKNLLRIGGIGLVERAVRACRAAESIDAVYVSTDDAASLAPRPTRAPESSVGRPRSPVTLPARRRRWCTRWTTSTWIGVSADVLVFVQCTSPFIDPATLDQGVALVRREEAESAFAAVATYEFLWRQSPERPTGLVTGLNHDRRRRPRRQDREPDYRETGAFYVMSVPGSGTHRHRFFGRTGSGAGVPADRGGDRLPR